LSWRELQIGKKRGKRGKQDEGQAFAWYYLTTFLPPFAADIDRVIAPTFLRSIGASLSQALRWSVFSPFLTPSTEFSFIVVAAERGEGWHSPVSVDPLSSVAFSRLW
jgi:hypothetical protein